MVPFRVLHGLTRLCLVSLSYSTYTVSFFLAVDNLLLRFTKRDTCPLFGPLVGTCLTTSRTFVRRTKLTLRMKCSKRKCTNQRTSLHSIPQRVSASRNFFDDPISAMSVSLDVVPPLKITTILIYNPQKSLAGKTCCVSVTCRGP